MGTMGCIGPVIDFEIVPGFETVLETSMGTMGCIGPVIDFETVLGTVRILDKLGRLGNQGNIGLDLGFGFAIVLDSIVCSIGLGIGTVLVIDHHVQIDPGTDVGIAIGLRVRIDSGIDVEIEIVLHGLGYFETGFGIEIGVHACSIGLGIGTVLGIVHHVQIDPGTDVGIAIGLRVRIDS